jgi:hypothetical protein
MGNMCTAESRRLPREERPQTKKMRTLLREAQRSSQRNPFLPVTKMSSSNSTASSNKTNNTPTRTIAESTSMETSASDAVMEDLRRNAVFHPLGLSDYEVRLQDMRCGYY